jgi:Cu(I)/Ag(I) efflux system periplasmic protein CusF
MKGSPPMKRTIATFLAATLVAGAAWATEADGEVRRIDKAQAKITLKHGEIKTLDMPPMTMVFRVKNPKWLDGLAVGDKVKFVAAQENGQYVVTQLAKAP